MAVREASRGAAARPTLEQARRRTPERSRAREPGRGRLDAAHYLPVYSGLRFSKKALAASFWSAVPKHMA